MKIKNILKKDAAAYCKNAATLITRLGFQPIPNNDRSQCIQTDLGVFVVHPPSMETWYPAPLEDLNGHFEEPARAAVITGCNPYSGKWNILHSEPDTILQEFESRMKSIGARALLPGEMDKVDVKTKTFADHAENWMIENGIVVPKRNTKRWTELYALYMDFVFEK